MIIKNKSYFKNPAVDKARFQNWVTQLEQVNACTYEKWSIQTSLGTTQIYGLNTANKQLSPLVLFPGFRTTALIWDLDRGLQSLAQKFRIFLVETNGQPNLSDGHSPAIKSLDYGVWGAEVFEQLQLESAYIAGASFGGLVCMKIALVIPDRIKGAFLLNPGCFRFVALSAKNIYYNLLPLIRPNAKNIKQFLKHLIFCKPNHGLSKVAENLLVEYLELALTQWKDNTDKPYYMGNSLNDIKVKTYLLVGDQDPIIPHKKSVERAKKHLGENLKVVKVFEQVGHGNECHAPCLDYIEQTLDMLENTSSPSQQVDLLV
ncbi:MAG: alpha/beta hydrolase [Bacteroidota bacterium]